MDVKRDGTQSFMTLQMLNKISVKLYSWYSFCGKRLSHNNKLKSRRNVFIYSFHRLHKTEHIYEQISMKLNNVHRWTTHVNKCNHA